MEKFEGILPALITPNDAEGHLNEDALRKVLEFNLKAGVHGFWVAGGTGESILLTDEENRRIASVTAGTVGDQAKIIMHVGAPTTERSVALAQHASEVGCHAICCVPPFFYRRSDDEIVKHYQSVGAAADLPLFVYNLPSATGVEITPDLMSKIQENVPQLRGLKHSALPFANIWKFAQMGLDCMTGSCLLMLPGLTIGATGCVDGPPNALPELWVAIWDAYQAGNLAGAKEAQHRARVAWESISVPGKGFHAAIKAAVSERVGVDCGPPRLPGEPLSVEQMEILRAAVRNLAL
ncbi:MAG: dihydrodipicolinate synthase family protein [Candidatus Latescibacterota bacterium]|nr:dihydrodipicolinate synthase family protein [Candidatus Latescibacterota bacterium]